MIHENPAWKQLAAEATAIKQTHLRDLLKDAGRCAALRVEHDGIIADFSRQNATTRTLHLLSELAKEAGLHRKIKAQFSGERINVTENRSVLHTALRAPKGQKLIVDGTDVVAQVHEVLDRIHTFAEQIRSGQRLGATGKPLVDVVAIGIGGSYLGPEFVAESLRFHPGCHAAAKGRRLRFIANVDPTDAARALEGLDPERTLVVVISKTFTTAETMLNAKTVRSWLVERLGPAAVARHMVAVSTNLKEVAAFGIDPANAFGFWDWVGGRYSVCSAVGVLPLALQFGWEPVQKFLAGAHAIDQHVHDAPLERNIPVLLGIFGVWNASFLNHPSRALLPYSQALHRFAAHIQQVDMESNGKRVDLSGRPLPFEAGEVDFGEPGTNGQHSFYQLVHQGRVVPADFIGFKRSQTPVTVDGETVSNHDELMANFFAQPDALAFGKTAEEVAAEGTPDWLVPHRVFPGNRPSSVLLLDELTPYSCGQLLALYEHRTMVQGFIWGVNSYDQWGVELGKVLAKQVRTQLAASRGGKAPIAGFNPATAAMLADYLR